MFVYLKMEIIFKNLNKKVYEKVKQKVKQNYKSIFIYNSKGLKYKKKIKIIFNYHY
jgi:hypothetical protein